MGKAHKMKMSPRGDERSQESEEKEKPFKTVRVSPKF
jgi:hypothetical protein